jgi:ketosteroid isomerase-like protein
VSQAVTVIHLIAGTVTEAVHTGQRVTVQHFADGRAVVKVYRDGRLTQAVSYRNAETATRDFDLALIPREDK